MSNPAEAVERLRAAGQYADAIDMALDALQKEVKFELAYDYHDGFQWCASLTLDGKTLKGWGESMERAAQDLEQQLREEAER